MLGLTLTLAMHRGLPMSKITSNFESTEEHLDFFESQNCSLEKEFEDFKIKIVKLENHIQNIELKLMKLALQLWESTQNA